MDTRRAFECVASGRSCPTKIWRKDQGWHVLAQYPAAVIVTLAVVSILVLAACGDVSTGGTPGANDGGAHGTLADGSLGAGDSGFLADGSFGRDAGSLADGSLPAPDSSDYQSAALPEGPTGGDDTSDDPLPVNDTGVVLVAGNRLYYLNQYRGLLVFDVTNADQPLLVGNSPTSGEPQALYANGNQVVAVLADAYGTTAQGAPFHGSVARVLDGSDPAHIQLVGEVQIRGYVQDSRLVGGVLYTVGTDRDMPYGSAWTGGTSNPHAVITSIGLGNGAPKKIAEQTIAGDHGAFAFASGALLASTYDSASFASTLQYVDISDSGGAIAELSSDPGAPVTDVRIVPTAGANDTVAWNAATRAELPDSATQVFSNGSLAYVATTSCAYAGCSGASQEVTVIDTSSGAPVKRGSVRLPVLASSDSSDWYSPTDYGWFSGIEVVQAGASTLAIRRPNSQEPLYVIDLSSPDAPVWSSANVLPSGASWWGNLQMLGGTLYASTFEPLNGACTSQTPGPTPSCRVAFYVVPIDLHDPAHPAVGAFISVPGLPIGASTTDPSTLYLADYRWTSQQVEATTLTSCKLSRGHCTLQGRVALKTTIGPAVVENDAVYATVDGELHWIDLTNPSAPVDHVVPTPSSAFGTLLAVSGDTALVTSGWIMAAADVYRLNGASAPVYQQTLRMPPFVQRAVLTGQSGNQYLAGGRWGVEALGP